MAYLRGDYYIWADGGERVHIWAADGADGWEASGWAMNSPGERRPNASGVGIPAAVLDEYVMMRFAQLIESRTVADVIDGALRHGNIGGEALKARADVIKSAIEGLQTTTR